MRSLWDDCLEGLPIRPVTKNLVNNLILDRPLSPAQITDFGVDSEDHYRALKTILLDGEELDGENRHIFEGGGGEKFAYLPALNDSDDGVDVIEAIVRRELSGWI